MGYSQNKLLEDEECVFVRNRIPKGVFWLKARFIILERNYKANPSFDEPKYNVGFEIMAQINDDDYHEGRALRIAIVFSGAIWNGSSFNEVDKDTWFIQNGGLYDNDVHVVFFVHEITELNKWYVVVVDLGNTINKALNLLRNEGLDIKKITIRGLQLYAEALGCEIKAKFDYIKTYVT